MVDVECESKVAVKWFTRSDHVYKWSVRQNENHEQTDTDFNGLHVARPGARVLPKKYV